jgi:hypothetical protein
MGTPPADKIKLLQAACEESVLLINYISEYTGRFSVDPSQQAEIAACGHPVLP